jgi:predicted N-acetyltransferase YhbS
VGRALIEAAVRDARARGATTVLVSTATADVGNLRFYQRCGFRFLSVDRDAFTPETGYPDPIEIDGIELRDRIWLSRDLPQA